MGFFADMFNKADNNLHKVGNDIRRKVTDMGDNISDNMTKFANDVKSNVNRWTDNMLAGWSEGYNQMNEGIDQMQAGAGFAGFVNCIKGYQYMNSGGFLGMGEGFKNMVKENNAVSYDELGNMSITANDDMNIFEKAATKLFGKSVADDYNRRDEIREAVNSGDVKRANKIATDHAIEVGGKAVGTVGFVASIAAIPFTGGTSGAVATAIAAGSGLVGTTGTITSTYMNSKFQHDNLSNDIATAVSNEVDILKSQGSLSEKNAEAYSDILSQYLTTASYMMSNTSDRDTFTQTVTALELIKPLEENYDPDVFVNTYSEFQNIYADSVASGEFTQNQADRLSSLGAMYVLSDDLSDKDYYSNMFSIQTEHLDMTDKQRSVYVDHLVNYAMGEYEDDADFMASLHSELCLREFVQPDGMLCIPADPDYNTVDNTYDLSQVVSESDVAKKTEIKNEKAVEHDTLCDEIAVGGYGFI